MCGSNHCHQLSAPVPCLCSGILLGITTSGCIAVFPLFCSYVRSESDRRLQTGKELGKERLLCRTAFPVHYWELTQL